MPSQHLPATQATDRLRAGQPITGCYISGKLELPPGEPWDQEVVLENCVVEQFSCLMVSFSQSVRLVNCRFKACQFTFSYFLDGLSIEACFFDDYLDFQAGGHNKAGAQVRLLHNRFTGFVNFFDCWYESAVLITDNQFLGGTNLLGTPHNIPVTFDVAPLLARNCGQLDAADEGPTNFPHG